ncbi:toxin-antitoxin system HicB family antitoxin [Embleya sp. MST-111070]|uniref:toxin-antitoxin system HicB family antitoxin n=1 Tax=Embleya sp. MST-111070 TaxID=3398231 RepID=UPI003F7322AA
MDLTPYVDNVRHEFLAAAEAGGERNLALAERLVGSLDSCVRLALLGALSSAAGEITRELAPGSVDIRLRGLDPGFVVTAPPPIPPPEPPADPDPTAGEDEGPVGRINFRPPEHLKARIEEAAAREGHSVNAWLVRTANAALGVDADRAAQRRPDGGRRHTGWAR